jgi:hypothetical protein
MMKKITGGWRKLHHDLIHDIFPAKYFTGNQIEKDETGKACGRCEEELKTVQDFRQEI